MLELGPGNGEVALALATKNPDDFHVLIDMNIHAADEIGRQIAKRNLKNVGVVTGVAHAELSRLDDRVEFDVVHCYFPSPLNNIAMPAPRLYDQITCREILRLTQTGSEFFTVSDKAFVIDRFEKRLAPAFRLGTWRPPISPLMEGAVIGTQNERIHCIARDVTPSVARLVRT
ncbi:hypothetical protein [Caulobacter sp.]|uniref:hypothetical protein n=1 Tax=Caulobacter sp. TaxID=78 RepID=UPI001B07F72C|nr:hypothetical protein [Caulobacter sp.]MBO9543878.1 hypothetical protein [Caulobacter sp.]